MLRARKAYLGARRGPGELAQIELDARVAVGAVRRGHLDERARQADAPDGPPSAPGAGAGVRELPAEREAPTDAADGEADPRADEERRDEHSDDAHHTLPAVTREGASMGRSA